MPLDLCMLLHRWFAEVWNEGREATVDELFAKEAVGHGLGESETDIHGPEEFKVFLRNMRTAIPDVRIRIEDILADGEKAAVRIVLEGTHSGDGLGVPASKAHIRLAGIVIVRVVNGQIVEGWNSWDQLGLFRQIGALPSPANDRFLSNPA